MTLTREQMIEALPGYVEKWPQKMSEAKELATAAFDAMSPKPLVWQRNGDHWAGGFGYVIRRMRAVSGRYYLTRRNAFGQEFDTLEQAKAAAEAHHQQTAWAAMPLADMIGGKG
jgi:hypothetical protein